MNILKTTIVAGFILIGSFTAYAQPEGRSDKRKKIEAQKVAFITTELNLTPEEAQIFWPLYNQSQDEQKKLRKEQRAMRTKSTGEGEVRKTIDTMTEQELEEKMDNMIEHEQAKLNLRKKYLIKYKEVLPIKKVAKLYQAEKKFKRKLMADIRQKGQQSPPNGGQGKRKGPKINNSVNLKYIQK